MIINDKINTYPNNDLKLTSQPKLWYKYYF